MKPIREYASGKTVLWGNGMKFTDVCAEVATEVIVDCIDLIEDSGAEEAVNVLRRTLATVNPTQLQLDFSAPYDG